MFSVLARRRTKVANIDIRINFVELPSTIAPASITWHLMWHVAVVSWLLPLSLLLISAPARARISISHYRNSNDICARAKALSSNTNVWNIIEKIILPSYCLPLTMGYRA